MALSSVEVLSGIDKAKLQAVLDNVEFVNMSEVRQYQCSNCRRVALYHYLATCKHVFCGNCHGQFHDKPCPIVKCVNRSINGVSQNEKFESGVYALKAHCAFYKYGCEQTIALANYLMHQKQCKYTIKKLLPKVWVPPHGYQHIEKVEEDVANLTSQMKVLRGKTEEIDKKYLTKYDLLENKISSFIENMEFQYRAKSDQMKAKIKAISNIVKDNALNDQFLKDINDKLVRENEAIKEEMSKLIDEKSRQMTVDITFKISEEMLKKLDCKTTDLKNDLNQSIQELKVKQDEVELNINSTLKEKSEELSTELVKSHILTSKQLNENIELRMIDFDNKFHKSTTNLKIMHDNFVKNNDFKFNDKLNEISKQMKMSKESWAKCLNTMLDEKSNELNAEFSKKLCIVKQGMKSKIEKNVKINTQKVEEQNTICKGLLEQLSIEKKEMKVWVKEIFSNTTQHVWRIKDWQLVQKKGKDIVSEVFNTRDNALKTRGRIMFKEGYVYPWVEFVYDSWFSKLYSFVYYHRRTFVISIRKGEEEAKKLHLVQEPGFSYNTAIEWLTTCKKLERSRCKFFDADSIEVRIIIEPLEILYKDFHSKDGILTWKLENYNQKKRDGMEYGHWIWSEYFYDDLGGRFKVSLYFHDDRIELHMHKVHDENNKSNKLRFCNVTSMILDQSGSHENKKQMITDKYFQTVSILRLANVAYVDIETPTFLKDDSIIIKVIMEECVKP